MIHCKVKVKAKAKAKDKVVCPYLQFVIPLLNSRIGGCDVEIC